MLLNKQTQLLGRGVLLASAFFVNQLFGGYVYDLSQTDYSKGKSGKESVTTILVDGAKIKMSGFDATSEMIFDGESKTMMMVDHGRKSYFEMDQESIAEITSKLKDAMAEMERQLANVPPAQREMMERMMKGKMPGAGEERPTNTVKRTGEKDTISGYKVEKVEVSSSDGSGQELWVVPWSELKGSEELADAFKGMSSIYDELLGALSQGPMAGMIGQKMQSGWFNELKSIEGFPVAAKSFNQAGKLVSETMLSGIEEKDVDASEFTAPKKYKKQKFKM